MQLVFVWMGQQLGEVGKMEVFHHLLLTVPCNVPEVIFWVKEAIQEDATLDAGMLEAEVGGVRHLGGVLDIGEEVYDAAGVWWKESAGVEMPINTSLSP